MSDDRLFCEKQNKRHRFRDKFELAPCKRDFFRQKGRAPVRYAVFGFGFDFCVKFFTPRVFGYAIFGSFPTRILTNAKNRSRRNRFGFISSPALTATTTEDE